MKLGLSLAVTDNERTRPIIDGTVAWEAIEPIVSVLDPGEIFWRQLKFAEFDVSEMSLASLFIRASLGHREWVALPIFTACRFFHTEMMVHVDAGIATPADLRGKRLGVPEFKQTAAAGRHAHPRRRRQQHREDAAQPRDRRNAALHQQPQRGRPQRCRPARTAGGAPALPRSAGRGPAVLREDRSLSDQPLRRRAIGLARRLAEAEPYVRLGLIEPAARAALGRDIFAYGVLAARPVLDTIRTYLEEQRLASEVPLLEAVFAKQTLTL
jgi:hypothetical protein